MLSFEDFFLKKKIDLLALKASEPLLYQEFSLHYQQMGEKSFDHTKKYWFNKLRKSYKLDEIEQPISPKVNKESILISKEDIASEETFAVKPTGFKPRFKAGTAGKVEVEKPKTEETTANEQSSIAKPTGFKPRFKTNVVKDTSEAEKQADSKESLTSTEEIEVSKPSGFKPRFKAGINKPAGDDDQIKEDKKEEPTISPDETKASKPAGFKPRFKAGVTKPVKSEDNIDSSELQKEDSTNDSNEESSSKPSGFKPRFKAGITKNSTENIGHGEEQSPEHSKNDKSESNDSPSMEEEKASTSKPTGFKPRFKAGVTKPSGDKNLQTENELAESLENKEEPKVETSKEDEQIVSSKPVGFKPRFKAGITKTDKPKDD